MRIALVLPLVLAACADTVDAPSLLPRPIEATRPDDVAPVAAAAVDPAHADLIERLTREARAAESAFDAALPKGERAGSVGSETWIAFEAARSAAEVARAPALDALTALDKAVADAIDAGKDTTALLSARAVIQRLVGRQDERLDALSR